MNRHRRSTSPKTAPFGAFPKKPLIIVEIAVQELERSAAGGTSRSGGVTEKPITPRVLRAASLSAAGRLEAARRCRAESSGWEVETHGEGDEARSPARLLGRGAARGLRRDR